MNEHLVAVALTAVERTHHCVQAGHAKVVRCQALEDANCLRQHLDEVGLCVSHKWTCLDSRVEQPQIEPLH
jgi:hypothetical protein